ncbi:MAG: hypothetical protein WC523_04025 [Patescibacteria group bacterium]
MKIVEEIKYIEKILRNPEPEEIILGLRAIIDETKAKGYDNLYIHWFDGVNAVLYGERKETQQEVEERLKEEKVKQEDKLNEKKEQEIKHALEVLKKYNVNK